MSRVILLTLLLFLSFQAIYGQDCIPPSPDISAWWPFDEPNGITINDVEEENDGILLGAERVAGLIEDAIHFNGVDNYISIPDNDLWAFGANDFTIEFWANFDRQGGGTVGHPDFVFISHDEGSGERKKWFFALGGGVLNFHINGPDFSGIFLVQAPFSPIVGQWYHLAITRADNVYTIFVDGIAIGSEENSRTIPNSDASLLIGQSGELFGGFMEGLLDEMTIYNRALSEEEIMAINDAGSAGKCKPIGTIEVSPKKGGDTGPVTLTIQGSDFVQGTSIQLVKGEQSIIGDPVEVTEDGRTINVTFDLTDREHGLWDIYSIIISRILYIRIYLFEVMLRKSIVNT